ncbi:MAG TPA: RsmE family RNA methyltransferase [Spirochaetia bacterium]|nr:RsmE family RNA methyltransferase [Spirochaetia bacterium]
MRQFVLPSNYTGTPTLALQGTAFHYIVNVLRIREGERFPGLDPDGIPVEIELLAVGPAECTIAIRPAARDQRPTDGEETGTESSQATVHLTLFQCVPKGHRMDLIVRQATETGVATIVPVMSRHTVPRFDDRDWRNKADRWSRVMREAMQQSGQRGIPRLEAPIDLAQVPSLWQSRGPGLLFHERPLAQESLHGYLFRDTSEVALVIGPEGGFAQVETKLLMDAGFRTVYLGENVLRVETATLFAIAAVRIVLLEKNRWKLTEK